jgi:hypothetical protein
MRLLLSGHDRKADEADALSLGIPAHTATTAYRRASSPLRLPPPPRGMSGRGQRWAGCPNVGHRPRSLIRSFGDKCLSIAANHPVRKLHLG